MLTGVIAVSSVLAAVLLIVGYVDRDDHGVVTWSGRLWLLLGMAIVCAGASAGWTVWQDPDRLREGEQYWAFAVPMYAIVYIPLSFACMLSWWAARWVLKRGWIPALIVAVAVWPVAGPWGAGATLGACLTADYVFNQGLV